MTVRRTAQVNLTLIHYVFTPKYRLDLFERPEVAALVESSMRYIAAKHGITIHALAIQPDHVHCFCELPPGVSYDKAAFFLKWFSSLRVRAVFNQVKTASPRAMWGHHYWNHSVGGGRSQVQTYIADQIRKFERGA